MKPLTLTSTQIRRMQIEKPNHGFIVINAAKEQGSGVQLIEFMLLDGVITNRDGSPVEWRLGDGKSVKYRLVCEVSEQAVPDPEDRSDMTNLFNIEVKK